MARKYGLAAYLIRYGMGSLPYRKPYRHRDTSLPRRDGTGYRITVAVNRMCTGMVGSPRLHYCTKKLGLIYSSSNFRHENSWDEKRWWSSYSSAPIIARAYHLKHKYHDAPKFGLGLQCSAMQPKFCETLYCPPINVGTFRFC